MPDPALLPTFFIIGAGKSGTTALHRYLATHPEIAMTEPKEPHVLVGADYRERARWYEELLDLDKPIRGEASTGYSAAPRVPEVPGNIASLIPTARLIYLVRDPVDRAIAHYAQEVTAHREERPISEAIDPFDPANFYVSASSYARQAENYLRHFPRDALLIVESADLQHDRRSTLERIFEHIGADPGFWDPGFEHEYNARAGENVRLGAGARRLRQTAAGRTYRRLVPESTRHRIAPQLRRRLGGREVRPEPSSELLVALAEALAPDVARLRSLTGQGYENWTV